MFQKAIAFIVVPFLIITLACGCVRSGNSRSDRVGGPCEYKSYPGRAVILSIAEAQKAGGDQVRRYEVKFAFKPQGDIEEPFAQVEGRTFNLYGKNFQYPDREFLQNHGIHVGAVLDGALQVIISGACTPLVFDFPALKQDP